jgi:hypothetical protein
VRERVVARTYEDRVTFLRTQGFGKTETARIIERYSERRDILPRASSRLNKLTLLQAVNLFPF